jgi:CheY-like chemotaxis protein
MKVLVVDDERDVADSLAALLKILGYDVCVAYSGDGAIEVAGRYRPSVVILDINMPGMDGLQTARRLKADRRLQRTTFVGHTAADIDDPFIKKVASRIGFRHLVIKGNLSSAPAILNVLLEIEEPAV